MSDEYQKTLAYLSALMSVMFALNFVALANVVPADVAPFMVGGSIIAVVGGIVLYVMALVLSHKKPRRLYEKWSGEVDA